MMSVEIKGIFMQLFISVVVSRLRVRERPEQNSGICGQGLNIGSHA